MGAFGGPLTVSKLWVRGELPEGYQDKFLKHLRTRAFHPLTPEEEAEERAGWCVAGSPFELELEEENVFYGPYLAIGLRVDRWRLPAAVLKAQLADATRETLAKNGRDRLTKGEKEELKERLTIRLKKKLLPSMRSSDFVWNIDRGIAWYWSQSTKSIEQLEVLFEQTFGLELSVNCPYLAATERPLSELELEALALVDSCPFHVERK